MSQSRVQPGIPTGGQFAGQAHDEVDIHLEPASHSLVGTNEWEPTAVPVNPAAASQWGTVNVIGGSRTPWGKADYVHYPAAGVVQVSTPGHGGVKLSPERNRAIPKALRNSSGWYEEDCEVYIVGMTHPDAFKGDYDVEHYRNGVREWFPDGYEEATGEIVTADQSYTRAKSQWEEAHRGELVATSASRIEDEPDMMAVTVAPLGVEGTPRVLKVPRDRYSDEALKEPHGRYDGRWVVPGDGFEDITPPPEPVVPVQTYHGINTDDLTPSQRRSVDKDLEQKWRAGDGTVSSLGDVLESRGMVRKNVTVEAGKRVYYLSDTENHAYIVSKATWGAVEVPDTRTPTQVAYGDLRFAQDKAERLTRNWASDDERMKARAQVLRAKEAVAAAEAAEHAATSAN